MYSTELFYLTVNVIVLTNLKCILVLKEKCKYSLYEFSNHNILSQWQPSAFIICEEFLEHVSKYYVLKK